MKALRGVDPPGQDLKPKGFMLARREGTRSGKAFGRSKISAEREATVRASLAAGNGIIKTARPVGNGRTGNATVAAIKTGM
jgi:hypothetical protein